ncbi:hypothetical protein TNCV_3562771 [Trichonephila clavipes]|nr:hypothetical protein TNCV_3562771 [Trichonephila clavipes]
MLSGYQCVDPDISPPEPTVCSHQKVVFQLDTLRENCGIIRKQASTDGGVLWKVMCVDVVQVRFVEWAQNEIAVVPDFHKRILFSDEAHFWLNGYVDKQNCRIWSEANPQVYVETPLHPEKLTVWCALWASGIILQKR